MKKPNEADYIDFWHDSTEEYDNYIKALEEYYDAVEKYHEKYKWHNLVEHEDDLPTKSGTYYCCVEKDTAPVEIDFDKSHNCFGSWIRDEHYELDEPCYEWYFEALEDTEVIAWKEIEWYSQSTE